MRHAAAIAVAAAAAVGLARGTSRAQDAAPAPAPMDAAEVHRVRGTLAWQRAVWRAQRDGYQRAVSELERARGESQGHSDFTSLFLLGMSYLRLGRVADAEPMLRDARAISPTFPGFVLTDALLAATSKTDNAEQAKNQAYAALTKYDEYIAKIEAYPKDGAFAAELLFLGYALRGRTNARIASKYDRAVADLDQALVVAAANGEPPASEITSLLAQMHQRLDQVGIAKKLIMEALARDPAEPVHYFNYGVVLSGAHEEAEAKKWLEAALVRRPDFPEARLKLAYVASKLDDPAAMRLHLEAAAAMYESRARNGTPTDARVQADLESGVGQYWMLVAKHRQEADDDAGARDAYVQAMAHLRAALAKEPGCVGALNLLIQVSALSDAPPGEIDELKRRLTDMQKLSDREIDPYHSTFC